MKRHYPSLAPLQLLVFLAAMSSAIVFSGCREKRPAVQTINRTELATIIKATSRADSLKEAMESEFGGRGYTFRVAFSSAGKDSNVVETLSGGPTSLSVYGAETFDEAIELDRELNRLLVEHELAGIEVLYEVHTEPGRGSPVMYPASKLAESAEFFAQIKKRQQDGGGQPATRTESK
jgi:hypothetical protein